MSDVGEPAPYQDESEAIPDDAVLLRRVAPEFIAFDEAGEPKAQSGAFQDYAEERARALGYPGPAMSVHLAAVLDEAGKDWAVVLEGHRSVSRIRVWRSSSACRRVRIRWSASSIRCSISPRRWSRGPSGAWRGARGQLGGRQWALFTGASEMSGMGRLR